MRPGPHSGIAGRIVIQLLLRTARTAALLLTAACLLIPGATVTRAECEQIGIPTLSRIQGKVVDEAGEPIPDVIIDVYPVATDRSVGSLHGSTRTDKQGRFRYKVKRKSDRETYELRLRLKDRTLDGIRTEVGSEMIARTEGYQNLLLTVGRGNCPDLTLAP